MRRDFSIVYFCVSYKHKIIVLYNPEQICGSMVSCMQHFPEQTKNNSLGKESNQDIRGGHTVHRTVYIILQQHTTISICTEIFNIVFHLCQCTYSTTL